MFRVAPNLRRDRSPRLIASLAHSAVAVEEVQRLRYRVFGRELGALPGARNGLDQDRFDPHCDHLLVRDTATNSVVGTYRLINPQQAARIGGYYSELEFDLGGLAALRPHLVEVGRACVDAAYRNGAVIAMLWSGLTRYAQSCGASYLMGCASVALNGGRESAGRICEYVRRNHLSPPHLRTQPRIPFPYDCAEVAHPKPPLPSLLKGYLRAGAYVCGEPALDADFNTADFLVLMPLARISPRYANHFVA